MKFYVKQKVFSLLENYDITDENGNMKYYVKQEFFSVGHCFKLYNCNDEFLYEVKQKIFSLLPKYELINNVGQVVSDISKKLTFISDSYVIDEFGWTISGDIFSHDYEIKCNDKVIATIHKKWFSIGDFYEFDIDESQNINLVLAVILMIDKVIDKRESC